MAEASFERWRRSASPPDRDRDRAAATVKSSTCVAPSTDSSAVDSSWLVALPSGTVDRPVGTDRVDRRRVATQVVTSVVEIDGVGVTTDVSTVVLVAVIRDLWSLVSAPSTWFVQGICDLRGRCPIRRDCSRARHGVVPRPRSLSPEPCIAKTA